MSTNERTYIRTIVKWSKSAALLAVAAVLLVAYVFVSTAHAESVKKQETYQAQLARTQQETSKMKNQLHESETKAETLSKEIQVRDDKIKQLEQENTELKE